MLLRKSVLSFVEAVYKFNGKFFFSFQTFL